MTDTPSNTWTLSKTELSVPHFSKVFGFELSTPTSDTKQWEIDGILDQIECDPENNELVDVDNEIVCTSGSALDFFKDVFDKLAEDENFGFIIEEYDELAQEDDATSGNEELYKLVSEYNRLRIIPPTELNATEVKNFLEQVVENVCNTDPG